MKRAITYGLIFMVAKMTFASATPVAKVESVNSQWHVVATRPEVAIEIPDVDALFQVGRELPVLQKNEKFYIALLPMPENPLLYRLCAIPRWDREHEPTAWITDRGALVLATSVETCKGSYIVADEEMRLLEESKLAYQVSIEHAGQTAIFSIPKKTDGISVEKITVAAKTQVDLSAASVSKNKKIVINNETIRALASVSPKRKHIEKMYLAGPVSTTRQISFEQFNPFASQITLSSISAMLFLASFYCWFRDKKKSRRRSGLPHPSIRLDIPPIEQRVIPIRTTQGADGDLSGSLQKMAIAEIIQFLNSSRETGRLEIKDKSRINSSVLLFQDGEIFDAKHEKEKGEAAARQIIALKQGNFSFKREAQIAEPRTISQSTMSIVLDVIKTLDENRIPA